MAYTDDAVKAKLSALNETQESIVTVAQWVMFHRRHADRTATLWLQRLKDSGSNKRLNLIYLANEVAQQSKARRKDDFLIAFSPIIAEATAIAYRGATNEVQTKLRRSVEVWRARQIFEVPIQEAIEARIDELDKSKSSSKKPTLGGSLFSSSSGPAAPPEIQPLVSLQIALSKASVTTASAVPTADAEYEKLTDPSKSVPTPPVYAARLSSLLKSLASAEGAVAESLRARTALVEGLEQMVEINKAAIMAEESQQASLASRKNTIEAKKREVEDGIMRGLSAESSPVNLQGSTVSDPRMNGRTSATPLTPTDPSRPDVEELTPPPEGSATPVPREIANSAAVTDDQYQALNNQGPMVLGEQLTGLPAQAGADLLSSLNIPPVRQYAGNSGGGLLKKRKLDDDSAVFGSGDDAMDDLDEDVAELLRQENGGR
ncbi:MAG: hypothetical protein Q9163_000475 [Psora crenata]